MGFLDEKRAVLAATKAAQEEATAKSASEAAAEKAAQEAAAEKAAADAEAEQAKQQEELAGRAARALKINTSAAAFGEFASKRSELIQAPDQKAGNLAGEEIKAYEEETGDTLSVEDKGVVFGESRSKLRQETKSELIDAHKQMKAIGEELKGMLEGASEEEQTKIREALASADPEVLKAKRAEIAKTAQERLDKANTEAEIKKMIADIPTREGARIKALTDLMGARVRTEPSFLNKIKEYAKNAGLGRANDKGGVAFNKDEQKALAQAFEKDVLPSEQAKADFEKNVTLGFSRDAQIYLLSRGRKALSMGKGGDTAYMAMAENFVSAQQEAVSVGLKYEYDANEKDDIDGLESVVKNMVKTGDIGEQRQLLDRIDSVGKNMRQKSRYRYNSGLFDRLDESLQKAREKAQ